MKKFLANENYSGPSIEFLKHPGVGIKSIASDHPGISDEQVMQIAIKEERVILTHDSDYGELIFKHGFKPRAGVVYFRIFDFEPVDPGKLLLDLIKDEFDFTNRLTVINENSIRQRS